MSESARPSKRQEWAMFAITLGVVMVVMTPLIFLNVRAGWAPALGVGWLLDPWVYKLVTGNTVPRSRHRHDVIVGTSIFIAFAFVLIVMGPFRD